MVTHNSPNRVAGYVNECALEGKQMVEEYPVSAIALAFGLGVLAGYGLMAMFTEEPTSRRVTHRLGAHILDSLTKVIPDSVMHPFR